MTTNMQTVQARLITHLKELHLPTFRERFSDLAEQARNEDASFEAYLLALCEEESEERRLNRIERMVRESQLPREKTLEALDLKRMGRKVGLQVRTLVQGDFVDRRENVLAFGNPGSGKTHLLKAVRQALSDQGASVGWLDASVASAAEFDERWAAVVLDDVHLYSTAQQAMAFNWFVNAISPANGAPRWVLAAGNLPPADLPLRDDLRSRLGWGHVFQLQLLDETARRAVLRQEADARGVFLGDEVMDFMLNRFSRDLGSLMQLLDQLDAYALRTQRAITIPLLKAMLESE